MMSRPTSALAAIRLSDRRVVARVEDEHHWLAPVRRQRDVSTSSRRQGEVRRLGPHLDARHQASTLARISSRGGIHLTGEVLVATVRRGRSSAAPGAGGSLSF